jgi:hypothetical protein
MAVNPSLESLAWMETLMPWKVSESLVFKYQHVGAKRQREWLLLSCEETTQINVMVNDGNKIPVRRLRGKIGFFRLTMHLSCLSIDSQLSQLNFKAFDS